MIIYGTGSTKVKEEAIFNKCNSCGNINTTTAYVFAKYVDIFWIPIFPIGKYASTQCSHCKQVLQEKEMPPDLKQTVMPFKNISKTPLKAFSGLFVIALLIVGGGIMAAMAGKDTEQYAATPAVGDRYYYKEDDGSFSTMKIMELSSDSIFFFLNGYTIDKKSKTRTIDITKNYDTTEYYGYSKQEINNMLKDKTVFQIKR
jgi:hypothetical protein